MAQVLPLSRWKNMKLPELEYFSCDEDEEDSDSGDKPIIIPTKPIVKASPQRLIIPKNTTVSRIKNRSRKRKIPPPHHLDLHLNDRESSGKLNYNSKMFEEIIP